MTNTAPGRSKLDDLLPNPHFRERHQRRIAATADQVWDALTSVTLRDLTITRPLVALRLGAQRGRLERPVATHGPAHMLVCEPPSYALGGSIARPWQWRPGRRSVASIAELVAFDEPGWTKYLVEFVIAEADDGCVLSTETRGRSTDRWARARFSAYWALIRPWSGLIRRDLLATTDRLAHRPPRSPTP